MIMTSFKRIPKHLRHYIFKHSPEILSGIGIFGVYMTAVLAVKSTPSALKLIEERKRRERRELTKKEVVQTCWKEYIPAGVSSLITTGCIVKSGRIHAKRHLATMALYSLTDKAFKEYQRKVVDTVGFKKEEKIRDAVMKDKLERSSLHSDILPVTTAGMVLCYDVPSDRYFTSTVEKVKRTEIHFNHMLRSEMRLTLNDLYYELGLEQTRLGENLGWNIEYHELIFQYSSQLTEDDRPCLMINYEFYPFH
jgi:hypothetical protein